MPDFVRVRDQITGHEYSISRKAVRRHHSVLDAPAVDRGGRPLRPVHKSSAKKKAAPASTPETNNSEES